MLVGDIRSHIPCLVGLEGAAPGCSIALRSDMEQDLLDVPMKPVSIITVPIRVGEGRDVTQPIKQEA